MTIQSTERKAGPFFTGTILPFTFKVFSKEDIQIIWTSAAGVESTLVLDSEYSVALNPDQDNTPGGSVTLNTAISGGANAVIIGDLEYDQGTDIRNQSGFEPEIVEDALDRVTILVQQLLEMAKRTLRIPASSSSTISTQLPQPTASNVLGWNGEANQLINLSPQDIATTVAFGTAFVDQFVGNGVETEFTLSANPALLANMDVQVGGVSLRNGIDFILLAGAVIKFTTPPAAPGVPGSPNIQIRGTVAVPQGFDTADVVVTQLPESGLWTTVQGFINRIVSSIGASVIGFIQAGVGAVMRTVENKLRETVSVKDFGAVGDGIADDTAAFALLTSYCKERAFLDILIPPGIYYVTTTVSFKRMWFFHINASGAAILPSPLGSWAQKPVVEFAACNFGEIRGIRVPTNIFNAAYWNSIPLADLPSCALMFRREPVGTGYTIQGLGIAGGDGCQGNKLYNSYLFGKFNKATYVNTRAETTYAEGCVFGGVACPAVIDTGTPSFVYQNDGVSNSNIDKTYHMCEFRLEGYILGTHFHPVIDCYDSLGFMRIMKCYFSFGGMQASATIVAGIRLTQTTGAGGFQWISVEDSYGENAGNNFVFLDINSFDTHNVKIDGWQHSQEAGATNAVVHYRGSQAANDLNLHLERIRPPTNTTPLIYVGHDMNGVVIKDSRGILSSAANRFIYNADVRMRADDIFASAPAGSYSVNALLPGAYTLVMDKYPTVSGFTRNRAVSIGTTTLTVTTSPNSLLYFNRSSSNVFDVNVTAAVNSTIEGPASVRAFEDLSIDYPIIGDFEIFVLSFSNSTTLKHNFTVNSTFKWILKSGADTTYAAGRAVQFMRNNVSMIEI